MSRYEALYGVAVVPPLEAVVTITGEAFWPPWRCWLHDQWEIAHDALLFAVVVTVLKVLFS